MSSLKTNARIAGFLYLLLVLIGPLRLIYIPSVVYVSRNAAATAANIVAHERLVRLGILGDLAGSTIVLFLTLALYRLFEGFDRRLAALIVILGGLMVTPIYFVNTINDAAALMLARGADVLAAIDKPQRDALVMLFLRLHHAGEVANEIFWGLWLFPLGALIIRSRYLPRFLGFWLLVNGFAYLVLSFTGVMLPQYEGTVFNYASPIMTGEIAVMLWLLIMGARERPSADATPARV